MTKTELIAKLAADADTTKATAAKALDALIDAVETSLAKGDKVSLTGFGTWKISETKARKGHNPQTGKEINIPAGKRPVFTAGAVLKASVAEKPKKKARGK